MTEYYSYISTKAAWDCIQTVFLCVPSQYAEDIDKCRQFAKESGWIDQAEENALVLIAPLAPKGWENVSRSLIPEFYEEHKNDFRAPGGVSIPGRDGVLWLWETMIYLVGYEDGADYAAEAVMAEPGFFAASAIYNGRINDFSYASKKTSCWFVRKPHDYQHINSEIPSSVWLIGNTSKETHDYFCRCAHVDMLKENVFDQIRTEVRHNSAEPAQEVRLSEQDSISAQSVMDTFFNHILRWKNGPDGALKNYLGKKDYAVSERFVHYCAEAGGLSYPYTVYLPEGISREQAEGLPIVFSIHGRGEPSWVFAEKNGWHKLADETKEFIAVFPDSPYNIWLIDRDRDAIKAILAQVLENYKADASRVYLSGFSNGAIFTAQQASTFPELFAAVSPWNGPGMNLKIDTYVYHEDFENSEYEMPFWINVGDSDNKAGSYREDELDIVLKPNGCSRDSEETWNGDNYYTIEKGYKEGERFNTRVFRNSNGSVRVGLTVMKNMPHGAIWDQSRAAWNFMKRFRRVDGNTKIEEI
ncbi:MAG: hypothetical protein IJM15_07630 [Erysipelotrichaceae bacterium]|nr:hypothetical protein [Erysipelotrichaceae bacterium]